jgi:hypothetical protein
VPLHKLKRWQSADAGWQRKPTSRQWTNTLQRWLHN